MNMAFNFGTRIASVILMLSILGGCAAAGVAIGKKNLEVQTRTSTSIFVDPVSRSKRTVYLDVKSGVMEFDRRAFKTFVKEQFVNNSDSGYKIVDDPDSAQFQMVAYVLNLEKTSPSAAKSMLDGGYTGAIAGGALAGAALSNGNPYRGAAAGAVIAGGVSFLANALVKDVTYMLVCDIQIKEKAGKGVIVRKDSSVSTKISDAGSSKQTYSEATNKKEYRTRIVTTANKANLKLEEAQELMFQKTAYAMAGFF